MTRVVSVHIRCVADAAQPRGASFTRAVAAIQVRRSSGSKRSSHRTTRLNGLRATASRETDEWLSTVETLSVSQCVLGVMR